MELWCSTNYKPYQSMSETKKRSSRIQCRGYAPGKHLRPYIANFWTMVSEVDLKEPVPHRVIPDGCVDIIFDLNARSYGKAASIVGTMTKPMFAELAGHVDYIAARFLPGGFLHFLGDSMSNLTDHIFPLDMLSGREGHNLVERLVSRNRIEERIRLLEVYFTRLLSENNKSDSVVRGALGVILEKHGNIRISDLAGIAGSSERQLHRKFDRWVGVGPKTFCKIIRFQNVCRMLGSGPKHGVLSAALDAGYYDQSHFIHEFSSLYGLRPIEFLQCKKF